MFFIYNQLIITYEYLCKILCFGSYEIRLNPYLAIKEKIFFYMNLLLIFFKKEHKTTFKLEKIAKEMSHEFKISSISNFLIVLLIVFSFGISKTFDDPKQHIEVVSHLIKFLRKTKNFPIDPSLWLSGKIIFWVDGSGCEKEVIDQGRSYLDKNINISNCIFSRSSQYSGSGGVIFVSGGSFIMNLNYSMFNNCVCSQYGGAIYFSSTFSSIRMICANSCSANWPHFSWLQASQVNQVEYLSVSNCSHTTSGYYPIYLYTGDQRVDNTNSSMNNAIQGSSILIESPSSFTSSHNTFSNNKVADSICLRFSSFSITITISYANIIHNNSPSKYGVVCAGGTRLKKMIYCIFQNNQNYLLCVNEGPLEVSHSFIGHSSSSYSTSLAVSIETNNSFTKAQTYIIEYHGSLICKFPSQSQDASAKSHLSWLIYSIIFVLFITLLWFLYFYRTKASVLQARHQLEENLNIDYG